MPQTVIRNAEITSQLNENGYCIVDFLSATQLQSLRDVNEKFCKTKDAENGAFLGVISKNIHDALHDILTASLNKWFHDFKEINAFVIKTPGKSSFVPIHQDVTAIDEEKYSTTNVWIPLQSIDEKNGVMYIVPRSHHIFFPYRCATIDPLTKNIEHVLQPYFIPIYLKAGQALFFDTRMFHYSLPNLSDQNRVVTVCRVFPKEADMVAYFKEPGSDSKIEMWRCPDDFLIYKHTQNENERPLNATLLGYKVANTEPLTLEEFEERRKVLGIVSQQNDASSAAYLETLRHPFSVGYDHP